MRLRKRQYILTWIALVTVIFAATALLLLPSSTSMTPGLKALAALVVWGLAIVSAIFLFLTGSGGTLAQIIQKNEDLKPAAASPGRQASEPVAKRALDIKSVAGKITRRIDPAMPPGSWGKQLINMLESEIEIMTGIFYYRDQQNVFTSAATYATPHSKETIHFTEGEGLNGQVAKNRQVQVIRNIPEHYAGVFSGLGSGTPAYLAIVPIVVGDRTVALLEVAGFKWAEDHLEQLFHVIARKLSEKTEGVHKEKKIGDEGTSLK